MTRPCTNRAPHEPHVHDDGDLWPVQCPGVRHVVVDLALVIPRQLRRAVRP